MKVWSILAIIIVAAVIFIVEFPLLKKKKKDLWFFSLFLVIFTAISVLEAGEVPLPNPLDYIQSFYQLFLG
ncbi:hypothetical protein GCM10010954_30450 [Halobacillus andaensis]|uniref:Uncharacterized protein n=1 Tax=Halobacillus andaensis TaxID=1176239 RepID=A0A917EZI4_HALAA|nr:hypothetical protein [Halobacillus andaensis]MBP2005150.1 hypothetical protein [Halobacillus andaensis]GGF29225.1 hypothetical protein GCM10010954_30450 [Halobacillus andaensis]